MDEKRKRIRVGGVPEHFNEIWQLALEKNLFRSENLDVEWISIREGTGLMIEKLKTNHLDVIVALTEGLINEICSNETSIRLIGTYVQSPLQWSISVENHSIYQTIEDLKGKTFGISRFKSGSHLMSLVLSTTFGWNSNDDLHFVVENHFDNLRLALTENRIDAFLWEYFMQKPFYDRNVYRHLANLFTPWPCFLLASRKDFIDENAVELMKMFDILRFQSKDFHQNRNNSSIERISSRFDLSLVDARKWFEQVEIHPTNFISKSTIETTIEALKLAQLIPKEKVFDDLNLFIDERISRIHVDIKSMRLYNKPELLISLRNNLRCHQLSKGPLSYEDLLDFDQNHYFGTQVLDIAADKLNFNSNSLKNVWSIQIGSNLGGCSRYLAGKYSSRLLAIELQSDLSEFASELTERCHLNHLIEHLTGNYLHLSEHLKENHYYSIVSWLTILHFNQNERKDLFDKSFRLIRRKGFFYLEDFIRIDVLTDEETKILQNDVFCHYLPTKDEYLSQLKQSAFDIVSSEDLTTLWKDFTQQRRIQFETNRNRLSEIHGEDLFSRLAFFYRSIEKLFQGNHVGGIRILAQKP